MLILLLHKTSPRHSLSGNTTRYTSKDISVLLLIRELSETSMNGRLCQGKLAESHGTQIMWLSFEDWNWKNIRMHTGISQIVNNAGRCNFTSVLQRAMQRVSCFHQHPLVFLFSMLCVTCDFLHHHHYRRQLNFTENADEDRAKKCQHVYQGAYSDLSHASN